MNIFKTANYVCHLEQVLFYVLFDLYPNLTLKTHDISGARHIITIATGTRRYITLHFNENASSDIILPIIVVFEYSIFHVTMLPLLRRR